MHPAPPRSITRLLNIRPARSATRRSTVQMSTTHCSNRGGRDELQRSTEGQRKPHCGLRIGCVFRKRKRVSAALAGPVSLICPDNVLRRVNNGADSTARSDSDKNRGGVRE